MSLLLEAILNMIHPNNIVALASTIRDRRATRLGLDSETHVRLSKFEQEYPEYDLPWLWLSMAINNPKNESESIIERMAMEPWNSPDPEIKALWDYISSKENLSNLVKRFENSDLNPYAKRTLEKAISIARCRF